jgi:hypothetical protein
VRIEGWAACGVLILLLSMPILFVVLVLKLFALRRGAKISAALLGRWEGRYRRRFWGEGIDLRIDNVAGEITWRVGDLVSTRIRLNWPSRRCLRLAPEDSVSQVRRLFGATEITLGDPAFDNSFWIESSDPPWARRFLDLGVRGDLLYLAGKLSTRIYLDLGPTGLSLRVPLVLVYSPVELGELVEFARSLLRKARDLAEEGGMALELVRVQAGSVCPVCGHPVAESALPCARCRTPHHADCWKYFGGCAIFACGVRARRSA